MKKIDLCPGLGYLDPEHFGFEMVWDEETILRKGFEWEDFQFLVDFRLKDQEWEAWMAGEKWSDNFRTHFPKQRITVF
jgi:hypothetical protein